MHTKEEIALISDQNEKDKGFLEDYRELVDNWKRDLGVKNEPEIQLIRIEEIQKQQEATKEK